MGTSPPRFRCMGLFSHAPQTKGVFPVLRIPISFSQAAMELWGVWPKWLGTSCYAEGRVAARCFTFAGAATGGRCTAGISAAAG